jgi:hypothetical protein
LLSPDSIQEEEEGDYKWLHKEYLRIVGYVERIVPELTTRNNQIHFRVSHSSFEKFVPIIEKMIKKCIRTCFKIKKFHAAAASLPPDI